MYEKSFFLEKALGNNAFSFEKRSNKRLFVPALIEADISDIAVWDTIAFEDRDFEGNLQSCVGLKNFYELKWNEKKIYLFDNHNHAYFFWWKEHLSSKEKDKKYTLIHIDEHSDMRDPWVYLDKNPSLEQVFDYTNYMVNVGNYIIPAIHDWLIEADVVQIRDTQSLKDYFDLDLETKDIILNLDLDFFEPALDFIDYNLKKKVILDAANKADIITVATSPFFIDQERALRVYRDIFRVS